MIRDSRSDLDEDPHQGRPADRPEERRGRREGRLRRRRQDRRRSARRLPATPPTACIDAAGLIVCPGLVDLAARLREPGFEYMATLESEMEAAVAGGVTSLACPPDTDPPLDEPGLVRDAEVPRQEPEPARVYPVGALTAGTEGRAADRDGGARRTRAASRSRRPTRRSPTTRCCAARCSTPRRSAFRCGCARRTRRSRDDGVAHDGQVATRLGPARDSGVRRDGRALDHPDPRAGRPARACTSPGSRAPRASTWSARRAGTGLPVTCDVGIHHAHLSEMDIGYFDPNTHLTPPLRSVRDRDALRAAPRRRHRGCDLLGPYAGRRGREAAAVRGSRVRRDRARAPAAAHAQVGRGDRGSRCRLALGKITCEAARVLNVDAGHLDAGSRRRHLHLRPGAALESGRRDPARARARTRPIAASS